MMQNSLERLLAGVATALREDIAPQLEDEFARGQALAGAEILENLVPRVQWRADDAEAVIALVRPLLTDPPHGGRDEHLRALAEAQRGGTRALDVALALLEREVEHLKAARELSRPAPRSPRPG
jgi:hypothetical protein